MSERFSILNVTEMEHYLGDAKVSPLINDIGDTTTIGASVLFRWRF